MSKRKRLLPFGFGNFFARLDGEARAKAEAEYNYDGEDLARERLKISKKYDELETSEYDHKSLKLDWKYQNLSDYDYEVKKAEIDFRDDNTALGLRLLEIDFEYHRITQDNFTKETAILKKEPWVICNLRMDDDGVYTGHYEIDWNGLWIDKLIAEGFHGNTDIDIINSWVNSLNRNILMEGEIGNEADVEDAEITRIPLDDDRAEYT